MNKPSRSDVQEGKIIDVFQNKDGEKVFEGTALLLKHEPSWRPDGMCYIKHEKENEVQAPTCYIWSSERWLVEFLSGPRQGTRAHRYIHFFCFIRTQFPSGYQRRGFAVEPFSEEEQEVYEILHHKFYNEEE